MDDSGVIKNRNTIITFFTFILLFAIMLSGCIEESPEEPKVIAGPDPNPSEASIYGNKIAYVNNYKDENSKYELWYYDLESEKNVKIPTTKECGTIPDIYENKIVWESNDNVVMYDLSNNNEIQITNHPYGVNRPKIYKDYIVWQDGRNAMGSENFDIYLYDMITNKEIQITNNTAPQLSPSIYENKIVWIDGRHGGGGDIYRYDIISKEETRITTGRGAVGSPRIFKDKIVWNEKEPDSFGLWDIYLFDLSSNTDKRITNSGKAYSPEIYENNIVWFDTRGGDGDIYMYDLDKNKEIVITSDSGYQMIPKIFDNKITWREEKKGSEDKNEYRLYLYTIGTETSTILGLEEDTFYISMVVFIIFLIIIIILLLRLRKKKRSKLKQETIEEFYEAVITETSSQKFRCPSCNNTFKVSGQKRPITVKCPHCGVSGELK
ncbi:MAG: hypothetical protein KAJ51_14875 [Thermoplasmata archaeon]|nr:hypothetical protein [Thermoplasmata archaeon]